MAQFPGKVPCEGYFDTRNVLETIKTGKRGRPIKKWVTHQVPVACPTGSDKTAAAARCKQCHALYREAKKMAPIDTPMGKEYLEEEVRRESKREEMKREKDKELQARFRPEPGLRTSPSSGAIEVLQAKDKQFMLPRLSAKKEQKLADEYWNLTLSPYTEDGKTIFATAPAHRDKFIQIDKEKYPKKPHLPPGMSEEKIGSLIDGYMMARGSTVKDASGTMLKDKYRNFLTDDNGVPISEVFYGIPPHPGRRAKEERGHLEYDYPGRVFDDKNEDVGRKGSDWWFTTWTVSPVADVQTAKMSTPTVIGKTKSGRKRIHPVSRSVADMTTGQFERAMVAMGGSSPNMTRGEVESEQKRLSQLASMSPYDYAKKSGIKDANFVFQCFDCGRHKKGGAGGKVLDTFCQKCSRISLGRKDAIWKSQAKRSNSIFSPELERLASGHPQTKNAVGRAKKQAQNNPGMDPLNFIDDDGTPFVQHIKRHFVKKRSNEYKEIELWDGFF